jgi:hypothetical protein
VKRARIVLLAADGHSNAEIACLVGMTEKTRWQLAEPHTVESNGVSALAAF